MSKLQQKTCSTFKPKEYFFFQYVLFSLTRPQKEVFIGVLNLGMPDSSAVEQVTVNHLVAGSNPARAANFLRSKNALESTPERFCF